jgi:sn-glycerol 3-phosphate transport system permease protein
MAGSVEQGLKHAHFKGIRLPVLLLLPQLTILLLFFFIPSLRALTQAFLLSDPFGNTVHFAGLDNFTQLLASESYRDSVRVTVVFTLAQNLLTMAAALVLAFATDRVIRGRGLYKAIILMPYAIAPVIAGVLWAFLFNPAVGPLASLLKSAGVAWDPNRVGSDAMILVVFAASWKHICYDYIFLLAGLLAIPASLMEAAAVDGARPLKRFVTIGLPLLGPTIFFLGVINFIYGFFEVFAIIDAVTRGGPAGATNVLVYKVYTDGFVNLDLGSSAAQSVILMAFALLMTVLQFRYAERRVNYDA